MKRLKNFLIWVVALYLLVSGIKIGIPYVRNVMFANEVDNIARGLNYDGTILRATNRLKEAARSNKIPITDKDFKIINDTGTNHTLVEVKYSVTVTTPLGLYSHVWDFNPKAEYGGK